MREIKFRAWNKKHKIMSAVNVLNIAFDGSHIVNIAVNVVKEFDYVWRSPDFELMQFTGLVDKREIEIYEGSIVEWNDGDDRWRVAVVEFNPDIQFRIVKNTRHKLSASEGEIFKYGCFAYADTQNHLEVIGDVYQNPELLKISK